MTLTDTGPLVALLDADDPYHTTCTAAAQRLPSSPLLTTWVCFTEAMYLLGAVGGYRYQAALWHLRSAGRLVLHDLTAAGSRPYDSADGEVPGHPDGPGGCVSGSGGRESRSASRVHNRL
jgi:predicted nucleic acid-binding protein